MLARKRRNISLPTSLFIALACLPSLARGQAFQNLDFENVVLKSPFDPQQPFGAVIAVPGWTFSHASPPSLGPHLGSLPQQFLVNDVTTVGGGFPFNDVRQGHYAVYMAAGVYPPLFDLASAQGPSIEQTGQVPTGVQSIRLRATSPFLFQFPQPDAATYNGPKAWNLTLNGTDIRLIPLSNGDFSGDATALAGVMTTLKIKINETYPFPGGFGPENVDVTVDSIRFSPIEYTQAPEPSSVLLAACALPLLRRRRAAAFSARK